MQIARPPDGFRVTIRENIRDQIDALSASEPSLAQAFADVVDRLKMIGHRVGRSLNSAPTGVGGARVYHATSPVGRWPSMLVSYTVLGDSLTITALKVVL